MSSSVELLLKKECPGLDEEIFQYICGKLH